MDEVRADPARPLLRQDQALALDARKAADARTDRHACTQTHLFGHVGQAGILDGLSRGVDPIDDEGVDLALDLVVDALAGIEAIFVVGRLHFAGDAALLVAGVEMRDRACTALAREDVLPGRLDVAPKRRHETQTSDHDTAHHLTPR